MRKKIFYNLFIILILIIFNSPSKKSLNHNVAIAYGLDNRYTFPTIVSMTSILENRFIHTNYIFYLLVDKKSFKDANKYLLKNLENKYQRCKVNIIELSDDIIKHANTKRYPLSAYYRLLLSELIPDLNRIIYLDGDTLIYRDLTEMFNLKMGNNVMLGFVDNSYSKAKKFGIKTYKYIVSGVLLINLKAIREENIFSKFLEFINKNQARLSQEDQTVINIVLHKRINFLPPKYGMWNFANKNAVLYHNKYKNPKLRIKAYKKMEILKAYYSPSILHFVKGKPWKYRAKRTRNRFRIDWWKYAKMTDVYRNKSLWNRKMSQY